jgi:hypothetical protein
MIISGYNWNEIKRQIRKEEKNKEIHTQNLQR